MINLTYLLTPSGILLTRSLYFYTEVGENFKANTTFNSIHPFKVSNYISKLRVQQLQFNYNTETKKHLGTDSFGKFREKM